MDNDTFGQTDAQIHQPQPYSKSLFQPIFCSPQHGMTLTENIQLQESVHNASWAVAEADSTMRSLLSYRFVFV